ncbi:MAG: ABC transporter substrate-binding protein [Clostridia bacterium]|nr:ABC transporter substrate-binding protein [Clostridia bacterium]
MKEQIYTIPVNEAYDTDSECPMCLLESKLEKETLDYTLGAAMMEPDFRENSNKKGYCNHHFELLFDKQNKLPLALILDTHFQEARKALSETAKKAPSSKGGLFKKKDGYARTLSEKLTQIADGCIVCDKINHTMERYADVLMYMWVNEPEFRAKFDNSKGLCLKHMKLLCDTAEKSIGSKANEFLSAMIEKEIKELERVQDDIHRFTLKFDYRNKDMEWGTAKDAPIRTIEKLTGYINSANKD